MRGQRLWRYMRPMLLAVFVVVGGAGTALALTSSSSNYQITESEFGSNSIDQTCSGSYCARATIGDLGAGDSASASHTATFGSITSDEPLLEVIVEPGTSNLGDLDTEHTATKTTTVRIRSYLSDGYMLQITGNPPSYNGHTLATPSTPTASMPGTEQFGINLVANTTPNVGTNPAQIPDNQTSFGEVNANYATANLFMYSSGDVVAHSDKSSGRTDYTVSVIVNISNDTPAGHYEGDYSAVVIPMY